ncbi:hypothetical protein EIN_059450 [Entamoeba invadens IP1]|uniref:hypothetical protein n=1 Tax=Entamoeba invadens IP1 TaxID=370355 RepID=UPI0002C3F896|nr:hypothetical protein EIN_059450 [Entamoeba invadens IP1]ELP93460.1 hypothetical protein EIN_059450 [Entamoeba invadens IP1]|eukprot:XP_004260231.1 hypothetical protein EIN_059450 [Entamoeba invadens IP1]
MPKTPFRRKTRKYTRELAEQKEQKKLDEDQQQKTTEAEIPPFGVQKTLLDTPPTSKTRVKDREEKEEGLLTDSDESPNRISCTSQQKEVVRNSVSLAESPKHIKQKKPRKERVDRPTCSIELLPDVADDPSQYSLPKRQIALTFKNLANYGKCGSLRVKELERRVYRWMLPVLEQPLTFVYPKSTPEHQP